MAIAGNLTFSGGYIHGIVGGTTGPSPNQGLVGWYSGQGVLKIHAVPLTSGVTSDLIVGGISFNAGHYLMFSNVWFTLGTGASVQVCAGALSTSSATLPGTDSPQETQSAAPIAVPGFDGNLTVGPVVFSSTVPFTVYLVAASSFSGGTVSAYGGLEWIQLP
jgi:hypothetical protein